MIDVDGDSTLNPVVYFISFNSENATICLDCSCFELPSINNESSCFLIMPNGFLDQRGSLENQGFIRIFIILKPRNDHHDFHESHTELEPLDLLKSDLSGLSYA